MSRTKRNFFLDEIHLGMYCNCDLMLTLELVFKAIVKNQDGRDDDVNMARDYLHSNRYFLILQKGN